MKLLLKLSCVICIILILFSCGSKKKIVENKKSTIEEVKKTDSTLFNSNVIANELKQNVTSKEIEKEETFEYEGAAGDTLKIIKLGKNGKILSGTIITGTGKATVKSKNKTENKTENKKEAAQKITNHKTAVKSEVSKKETELIKNIDIKKTGFTFTTWLIIISMVIILISFWYLNNKFKIVTRIKSFLKTLISYAGK